MIWVLWILTSLTVWQKSAREQSKKNFLRLLFVLDELARSSLWKTFSDFSFNLELAYEAIYYFISLSLFLYSNFSVKLNCNRICSWMNHLISLHILSELLMRSLIFTWLVCESAIWCLILAKQKQCAITCAAIFLTYLHWQTENSISDTHIWFKNAVSSILSVLI